MVFILRFFKRYRFINGLFLLFSIIIIYFTFDKRVSDTEVNFKTSISKSVIQVKTFLAIIILTHIANEAQRSILRDSWLTLINNNPEIKYIFVVGGKNANNKQKFLITDEIKNYGDILYLPNVEDSYEFLTYKVLQSFLFLSEHWKFEYLLKCDDDSFVRAFDILNELKTTLNIPNLYWGFFNGAARVKRHGKWKEENWFLCDNYLPYALGGGYILAKRLVQIIANNSVHLRLYKTEDVSVGTWLAPFNIIRHHDPRFDTEYRSRGCSNSYLITHKKTVLEMYEYYNQLKSTNNLCKKEYKHDLSYVYDWNVPPSKCCKRHNISVP